MNKIMEFMETKLAPTFSKLGANPYLLGIKNGMIATVPFTIFGSIFLISHSFQTMLGKLLLSRIRQCRMSLT